MPRFQGTPVEQPKKGGRFGGTPAEAGAPTGIAKPRANDSDFARLITGKPKKDSPFRGFGMGFRNTLEGAAGVLDFFGGPLKYGVEKATGIPQRGFTDLVREGADYVGLPQARTPTERVVADVNRALGGTAFTMGAGGLAGPQSSLGQLLASNPRAQIAGATTGATSAGVTREAGGGQGAQLTAGLVGGLLPAAVTTGGAAGARGLIRGGEQGRKRVEANIEAFGKAGTTPTVGQATEGRISRGIESTLSRLPGSASVMARRAEQQQREIGKGTSRLAELLSSRRSAEDAGRAVERGVKGQGGLMDRTKGTLSRLYERLDRQISPDARVSVENTLRTLPMLNPSIPGAPATSPLFQNARIQGIERSLTADAWSPESLLTRPEVRAEAGDFRQWLQGQADDIAAQNATDAERIARENVMRRALGRPEIVHEPYPVMTADEIESEVSNFANSKVDGRLPYEAAKKLRTLVGDEIDNASIVSDVPRSKWRGLYGALSEDMRAAADDAGPAAQAAFSRANNYARARAGRLEALDHVLGAGGGPEGIFRAAMTGSKEGATTLRAVMRSIPEQERRQVSATVLQRMGRAVNSQQNEVGDVFSTQTFLTNWNNLAPEAKSVLFGGYGPKFNADMDKIAKVASNLRDGSKVFANPSGTAAAGAQVGGYATLASTFLTSLFTGNPLPFGGAVAGMTSTNAAARLMTNPKFVSWLAKATEMPVGAAHSQAPVLQQIIKDEGLDETQ